MLGAKDTSFYSIHYLAGNDFVGDISRKGNGTLIANYKSPSSALRFTLISKFVDFERITASILGGFMVKLDRGWILLVVIGLCLSFQALAQTSGSISGVVTDERQAVLPGLKVTARNVDTN